MSWTRQALYVLLSFLSLTMYLISLPTLVSRLFPIHSDDPLPLSSKHSLEQLSRRGASGSELNNTSLLQNTSSVGRILFEWPPAPFRYGRRSQDHQIRVISYTAAALPEYEWSALVHLLLDTANYIWTIHPGASDALEPSDLSFSCRDPLQILMPRYNFHVTIHNSVVNVGSPHTSLSVSRAMSATVALLQNFREAHLMEIVPYEDGVARRMVSVRHTVPGINYRLMQCEAQ